MQQLKLKARLPHPCMSDMRARPCADQAQAFAQSYSETVAEQSVDAVAIAIADAITKGENCRASVEVRACAGCVGTEWSRCAGFGIDGVLGCCDPSHVCMQRNWMTAMCVDQEYTPPECAPPLVCVHTHDYIALFINNNTVLLLAKLEFGPFWAGRVTLGLS